MTELIGCDRDGRMTLWGTGNVLPASAFETHQCDDRTWIDCGHYVIDWKGHAITVHCGNMADGQVGLLFMCSGGMKIVMTRAEAESMLLGKVIPDPEQEARISQALRECMEAARRRNMAPHRQRGHI